MFAKLEAFLRKNFHFLLAVAVVLCLLHYRYGKSSFRDRIRPDSPEWAYGSIYGGFRENLDIRDIRDFGGIGDQGFVPIGSMQTGHQDLQEFKELDF